MLESLNEDEETPEAEEELARREMAIIEASVRAFALLGDLVFTARRTNMMNCKRESDRCLT